MKNMQLYSRLVHKANNECQAQSEASDSSSTISDVESSYFSESESEDEALAIIQNDPSLGARVWKQTLKLFSRSLGERSKTSTMNLKQ